MMAWHQVANRLLPKPIMTKFRDATQYHYAMMINGVLRTKCSTPMNIWEASVNVFMKNIPINKTDIYRIVNWFAESICHIRTKLYKLYEGYCKGYADCHITCPDSKVHGANMGPIWGRQDPGGPHVGPMNFAIWVVTKNPPYLEHWYNRWLG